MQIKLEIRDILTILVTLVTCGTALFVAYLHRRQMRQNEAYRVNPEAGLTPPPIPVWAFVKRHGPLILLIVIILSLVSELASSKPVTRSTVFTIAVNVAGILLLLVARITEGIYNLLIILADSFIRGTKQHSDLIDRHTTLIGDILAFLKLHLKRQSD